MTNQKNEGVGSGSEEKMPHQQDDAPAGSDTNAQSDSRQTITYVFPSSGLNSKDNTVIVGGTNLTAVNGVYFGNLFCYITEYSSDGTLLTVKVTANAQVGSVTVTAGNASLPNGYEFLRPVVGYRAFAKWSSDGDTWAKASYSKFQKRVPKQKSYSLSLFKDDGSPLANTHDDPSVVWKVTMCAMLDDTKIVLLDPDPAVQNQTDKQYPPPGNRGLVLWQTKQACMPCNLKITALSVGTAVLSWDRAPDPIADNYEITGYRVFRKPQAQSEWPADQRWYGDTTDTKMVIGAETVPCSYTVLPKARRRHDVQEIVFGTNAKGVPFPDDQSNMVLDYGTPKLLGQYPGPYGQVFVLQDSIGSVSITAYFDDMQGLEKSKVAYQWQKANVSYPRVTNPEDWNDMLGNLVPYEGHHTPALSFGRAGYPADGSQAGWYRLRARNGATTNRADVFSSPVRVYVSTAGTPALASQSYSSAKTVFTKAGTQQELSLTAQFNNVTGEAYSWLWSKISPVGPYAHSGNWRDIGGGSTRRIWFGDGLTAGADTDDAGWYQLQVNVGGQYAFSDPVYVKIGNGGDPRRVPAKDGSIITQYPAAGVNVDVPMDATSDAARVSISAYPSPFAASTGFTPYTGMAWERSLDGESGWTNLTHEKEKNGPPPGAFPPDSDVIGKNSTLLIFTPNGSFAAYSKRVSGWYRLHFLDREEKVSGNWFTGYTGSEQHLIPKYSQPVQVTVVEAGTEGPRLQSQSQGVFAATVGSFGADAVSIGAYFLNMDGVRNGYRWKYNPSTSTYPPTTGWTDAIPAKETLVGLGTPTLTFGISSGVGAQASSTGWYLLVATNPFGTASSDAIHVYIRDLSEFKRPTISSVSPSSGPASGGTTVTITGANLTGAELVLFAGNSGPNQASAALGWNIVVEEGGNKLTVVTPAHKVGKSLVAVKTPYADPTDQRVLFTFT